MRREETTVTNGRWSVSVTTGSDFAGAILSVSAYPLGMGRGKPEMRGDGDSKRFPSRTEAWEFARSRGYITPYRRRAMLGKPWDAPRDTATEIARRERGISRGRNRLARTGG